MKKLFIVMIAVLAAVSAQAQLRTSRTFTKTKSRTEWIVRVGPSFNRLTGYDKDDIEGAKVGGKVGFDIDFGFNKYFGQSSAYWGMELGVGTRGTKFEFAGSDDSLGATMYDIKWSPITVGYKYAITDQFRVDPHIGIYASYDISTSANEVNNVTIDGFENGFDAGLQLGVGFWFNRINLDFMYQFGFVNANPEITHNYSSWNYIEGGKTSNFLIRVGYSF